MPSFDYATVFATLPLPAILIDPQDTVVDVNEAYLAARPHGIEHGGRETLLGQPIWNVAAVDDPLLSQERVADFCLRRGLQNFCKRAIHHRCWNALSPPTRVRQFFME